MRLTKLRARARKLRSFTRIPRAVAFAFAGALTVGSSCTGFALTEFVEPQLGESLVAGRLLCRRICSTCDGSTDVKQWYDGEGSQSSHTFCWNPKGEAVEISEFLPLLVNVTLVALAVTLCFGVYLALIRMARAGLVCVHGSIASIRRARTHSGQTPYR